MEAHSGFGKGSALTAAVGFRSERGPILIAIMLATGVVAANATMLATAVPSIVADLGGFELFPWLFTVFLLAQAVTTPLYSKLSDTIGRKPIILLGLGLFLLASVAAGFAWDMPSLIFYRIVQGLAAGAVQPMAVTITGDIYSVAERAKVQAYIASVWAVASVSGPIAAGLLVEFVSWRWIFWLNVPLCILAGWMIFRGFKERVERTRRTLDVAGALLLALGVSALLVGVLQGGRTWEWLSLPSAALLSITLIASVGFVLVERRAAEPVLPLWIFQRRLLLSTTLTAVGIGAAFMALTSYVPTYLVAALATPPIVAGLAVSMISIGWPIAAANAGHIYLRWGFRTAALLGSVIIVVALVVLSVSAQTPNLAIVALCCALVGAGMGFVANPTLIASQSSVAWNERGVVSGMNLFARSIGSAIGVAVLGALANATIAASGGVDAPGAVTDGAQVVFTAATAIAVVTVGAVLLMPRTGAPDDATAKPRD